jgi:hypothetical protein
MASLTTMLTNIMLADQHLTKSHMFTKNTSVSTAASVILAAECFTHHVGGP